MDMDDFEVAFDSFADDAAEWEAEQVFQDNENDGEDFDGEVSDEGDDDFNDDDDGEDGWLDGSYEE